MKERPHICCPCSRLSAEGAWTIERLPAIPERYQCQRWPAQQNDNLPDPSACHSGQVSRPHVRNQLQLCHCLTACHNHPLEPWSVFLSLLRRIQQQLRHQLARLHVLTRMLPKYAVLGAQVLQCCSKLSQWGKGYLQAPQFWPAVSSPCPTSTYCVTK